MSGEANAETQRELQAAADQFATDITAIFSHIEKWMLPDVAVADIHSYGLCEDHKTLMIMADLTDNRTLIISICPGERPTAYVSE